MNSSQLITREDLEEIAIDLTGKDVDAFLTHLNETLEERIGLEITESLDDEQLEELVELQKNGDDEAVGTWIDQNVPQLKEIAEDERDILLGELAENANDINETV